MQTVIWRILISHPADCQHVHAQSAVKAVLFNFELVYLK